MAGLAQARMPVLETLKNDALPLAASAAKVWQGAAVCIDTSAGFAKIMAASNANLVRVGIAAETVDNSAGAAGAASVLVELDHEISGQWFDNVTGSGKVVNLYSNVYAVDDHTVGNAAIGGGSIMGVCWKLDTLLGVLVVPSDVL